jgi:hypothetical protein
MRNFMMAACVVVAFGACGKNKFEQAASDTEGFRDKMCACKDKGDKAAQKECAKAVAADMEEWEKSMSEKFKNEKDEPPDEIKDRAKKARKEGRECGRAIREGADGAGAGGPSGDGRAIDGLIPQATEIKDKMCACTNKACVDGVDKDFTAWAERHVKELNASQTPDQQKKFGELAQQMATCAAKATTAK